MKKLLTITIVAAICGTAAAKGRIEVGISLGFSSLEIEDSAIPQSVKDEASNPSIVNPFSGRLFDKSTIGTYDPGETFNYGDLGISVHWILNKNSRFSPYAGGILFYPFKTGEDYDISTHKGSFGKGYTYSNVLGGGVDFVRYTYGIRYEKGLLNLVEPEVGIKLNDDEFGVSFGVSYRRVDLTYYKGIEAFGSTEFLTELGSSQHNVFTYRLRISGKLEDEENAWWGMAPSYSTGDGLRGWGIGMYAAFLSK